MSNKDERLALVDFFRTQINLHAQIIVSLIIAIFSQGVATYFLPERIEFLKFPLILAGLGFFGALIILEWFKLFWLGKLWNASLIAKEKTFKQFFTKKPKVDIEETTIVKIYLGAHELVIAAIKTGFIDVMKTILVFLSLHSLYELVFSILVSTIFFVIPFSFASNFELKEILSVSVPFNYLSDNRMVLFLLIILLFTLLSGVKHRKCCTRAQIKESLKPRDLEQLAGID